MIAEEIPNKYLRRCFMVLMTGVVLVCAIQMLIVEFYKGFIKTIKYCGEWYKDMWLGLDN